MFRLTLRTLLARKVRLVMSTLAIVLGIGFLAGVMVFSNGLGSTFDGIIKGSTPDALVRPAGTGSFEAVGAGNATTLAPGESVEKEYALRAYYQFAEPGDYTLSGIYHNKWSGEDIIGQKAWTGQVESAPITIPIEAAGQESKGK